MDPVPLLLIGRYADDFVLLVSGDRYHAEALREEVSAILTPLGLRLAPEKTRVVHIDEGFDFLGFHIPADAETRNEQASRLHHALPEIYTEGSGPGADKTYRSTLNTDLDELITSLNQSLRGWANYLRHGVSKATFDTVDNHAWLRLVEWIRRNTTTSAGNNSGVASVTGAGGSPTTGSNSPAPPASR